MTKIADELDTLDKSIDNLSAAHVAGTEYRVLSARNGSITAYSVDIAQLSCPCPDHQKSKETHGVCAHLAKALLVHDSHKEAKDWAAQDLAMLSNDANELISKLDDATDWATTTIESEAVAAESEAVADGKEPNTPDTAEQVDKEAENKAQMLQSAFDDHIDDMIVTVSDGIIFFKTGYETEEEWPYPGFDSTFDAITSPDCLEFVQSAEYGESPNEHRWHDSKPGEHFKNALLPETVPEYIQELSL
jgi:hypothetical protein